ncbi:MAG: DUF1330 domain-containing protein [Saprospiraceae bacterium]|nr:DUF1330 domain-containing protein [Saprospiraceae bacterium]
MIYITQLVFVHPGKEDQFLQFEDQVLPMMAGYSGKMLHRVRPLEDQFIDHTGERPYEIHILSFDSTDQLAAFMDDPRRKSILPLKTGAIRSSLTIQGQLV